MKRHLTLNRVYWFSAAHRLHSKSLSEKENRIVYDKCNNLQGHGHDYKIEISLLGSPDPQTGMIFSLDSFDAIVEEILCRLNHRHLDKEVAYFKDHPSTGENIVAYLWQELESRFPPNHLFHMKLWETKNNYFEYVNRRFRNEYN